MDKEVALAEIELRMLGIKNTLNPKEHQNLDDRSNPGINRVSLESELARLEAIHRKVKFGRKTK